MNQKNTIHDILSQREEFLVVGLTGRVGSGCSKVAQVLATSYENMNFPHPEPQAGLRSLSEEERITRIIAEYAERHWIKFDVIQAGAIIATFILDDDRCFARDVSMELGKTYDKESNKEFYHYLYKQISERIIQFSKNTLTGNPELTYHAGELISTAYSERCLNELKERLRPLTRLTNDKRTWNYFKSANTDKNFTALFYSRPAVACPLITKRATRYTPLNDDSWKCASNMMNYLYYDVLRKYPRIHRRDYLENVNELLEFFAAHCLLAKLDEIQRKKEPEIELWKWMRQLNKSVVSTEAITDSVPQIEKYVFVKYLTPWLGKATRQYIEEPLGGDAYARLFQRYGQMIRYDGKLKTYGEESDHTRHSTQEELWEPSMDIFAIPRRINMHIKVLRHPFHSEKHRPVYIVVDSIKNVFEAIYLRYRYSAFYLWAITTDAPVRERRLSDKHFTDIQVKLMEWNEYPTQGQDVIIKADKLLAGKKLEPEDTKNWDKICDTLAKKLNQAELDFYMGKFSSKTSKKTVSGKGNEDYKKFDRFDQIRRGFFRDGTYVFYCQDIDSCVCNADVYLFNNATSETDIKNNSRLLEAVVRNVSLAMYPCLVRPTPVERCMQIALSAKVNSGCLSRQVGAVVTDAQYNILAIGWNDVPCGEVPCAYKSFRDICSSADQDAYSDYELHNLDFRSRLADYSNVYSAQNVNLRGLPFNYCFKDIHKKGKDPMRSRAMHAEEKALALCGREAEGGYLFTTSSPCEMCSKNAKNHKIKKIYYLEAYPGISQAQYTNSGDTNNRAELILFSGAVGRAYMQMYTPLLPHKDVLEHLGIDFKKDPSDLTDIKK